MRIQEAIDSGYAFKSRVHKEWMSKEGLDGKILVMSFDDIVADDWEINKTKKKYWRWAYRQEGRGIIRVFLFLWPTKNTITKAQKL